MSNDEKLTKKQIEVYLRNGQRELEDKLMTSQDSYTEMLKPDHKSKQALEYVRGTVLIDHTNYSDAMVDNMRLMAFCAGYDKARAEVIEAFRAYANDEDEWLHKVIDDVLTKLSEGK